jgi:hypothetical protein
MRAGEALGQPVAEGSQAEHVEQLVAAGPPAGHAVNFGENGHVLVDRQVAVQRKSLAEIADPARQRLVIAHRIEPEHGHAASSGSSRPRNRAERGRLPGAVRADQAEHLPLPHGEGQAIDRRQCSVPPDKPLDRR